MPLTVTNVVLGHFFVPLQKKNESGLSLFFWHIIFFCCDIIVLRGSGLDIHTQISCIEVEGHVVLQNLNISQRVNTETGCWPDSHLEQQ